ncbi:NAD-dependent epimerase/dehydratase family protein [Shewanella canadensis]|uniref:NAD-dependent epimerase/dehydratase family protein n=1 Tax=Shewanella canadensis TaxID=271096 RepID=A0A431WQX3_9GAMM|nr:NAD(P)H-binding protein [Shewanella canadensis]RTR37565.1 NAD-dependent epimerase/dehydratase family protein [Shewanella canadensis]
MTIKTLALLGATGLVGQQVVKEALAQGYHLRILARTPSKVKPHPNVTVIQGDARDSESLDILLKGAEAVVSTLGPAGINQSMKAARASARDMPCFNSTRALLPLLAKHNIRRFILTGGVSLKLPEDRNGFFMNFLLSRVAPRLLGDIYIDREKEYELLQQSDINWTVARCGAMDDAPSSKPLKTSGKKFQGGKVSTHLLSRFLLDQVNDDQFVGKGVYMAS